MKMVKEYVYLFRGVEHYMSEETARILNYALALNKSNERYIKQTKKHDKNR